LSGGGLLCRSCLKVSPLVDRCYSEFLLGLTLRSQSGHDGRLNYKRDVYTALLREFLKLSESLCGQANRFE
jgi:hypothetical protein